MSRRGPLGRLVPRLLISVALCLSLVTNPVLVSASLSGESPLPPAPLTVPTPAPEVLEDGKHGPLSKVGGRLARMYRDYAESVPPAGLVVAQAAGAPALVTIDAVAAGDARHLQADLAALGIQRASRYGPVVSGLLPVSAIGDLAALESLRFARPAQAFTRAGLTTSQGDLALRADEARALSSLSGAGVFVGVLSDSYDCLGGAATDVATGDLPSGVLIQRELSDCSGATDEGRAMLQIVHDVAPGAGLAFYTAFEGQAGFAQGILELAAAGARVIVDDVGYFEEPMFQDGIISQAVDAVAAQGVTYFSAAGNSGRDAYEGVFTPGPEIPDLGVPHLFGPNDTLQSITVPPGTGFVLAFQWDSPFYSVSGGGGSPNDVDIYLLDGAGAAILAGSEDDNLGRDPTEVFSFFNPSDSGTSSFNLLITRYDGPNPGVMRYLLYGFAGTINEYATDTGSLWGHGAAAGARAVGAAYYRQTPRFGVMPPQLEPYSSAGPARILFTTTGAPTSEIRQKPEIVAPDGANTTFFGFQAADGDSYPNFFGTSAAAPHAAAVATLIFQARPSWSPAAVYQALETTATDMGPAGFDFDSGYGLIRADLAVAAAVAGSTPAATPQTLTATEDTPLSITLGGSDADSDQLTFSIATLPAHGVLNGTPPTVTYTPALNYNGLDAFTFTVSDGSMTSEAATVSLTVTAVNDRPVALPQSLTVLQGLSRNLTLTGTDVEGAPLTYAIATAPAHGSLSGSGPARTYTPAAGYAGPDSFTFTVSDGVLTSEPATVSVTVTPNTPATVAAVLRSGLYAQRLWTLQTATFTDVDTDDWHTATIDWGDGTVTAGVVTEVTGRVSGAHRYQTPGLYTVTVTVTDNRGAAGQDTYDAAVRPHPRSRR